MIAILDYDAGNIKSVEKAVDYLGETAVITRDKDEILTASGVILPGVGSFGEAMSRLHEYNLIPIIKEVIEKHTPFLGICLGLQLLFETSEESPGVEGLGILPGQIVKFKDDSLKIPHIGWNSITFPKKGRLFNGIDDGAFVYFVHSYYLNSYDKDIVSAECEYGVKFHASVEKDNVFACQFHPEKSSAVGLRILKNFLSVCGSEN